MDRRSFLAWSAASPVSVAAGAVARRPYRQTVAAACGSPVATGLGNLDEVLGGGLTPGGVTLLGAPPRRGLVHPLTLSIIDHHLQCQGRPVVFVTASLSRGDVLWRLASMRAGVPSHVTRHERWENDEQRKGYEQALEAIEKSPLHYESIQRPRTLADLERSLRQVHRHHPLALVVIDDVGGLRDLRCAVAPEHAAARVGRRLQRLARATGAPILAVCWFAWVIQLGEWSEEWPEFLPPDERNLGPRMPIVDSCDAFLIASRLPIERRGYGRFSIDVSFHPLASKGHCSLHTIDAATWRVSEGA